MVLPPAPRPGTCNLQCFNGGSCFLNARRQPKCRCQPRYTGDKCELDQCWEHCRNGGTCAASPSGTTFSSLARTTPSFLTPASNPLAPPQANPQPLPYLALPLPTLTLPVHTPVSCPSAICLPPGAGVSQPCSSAVGPGDSVGHSPAHTSSPARHAHVPLPHRLHRPKMHPAGVCGLLCKQQHLHCQPRQPAPVPMPTWLPG